MIETYKVVAFIMIAGLLTTLGCQYHVNVKDNEIAVKDVSLSACFAIASEAERERDELRLMVARDDKLLDQLLHGTWDRDCQYELVPGELLADGSIRSSLIQHCEEK